MKTLYLYFSDLHLEKRFKKNENFEFIFEEIDVYKEKFPEHNIHLIAAGDISVANKSYTYDFFERLSLNVDNLFYVFGNHEFYGGKLNTEIKSFKEKFSNFIPNLHVLENDMIEFNNHVIIGATLWTSFNNGEKESLQVAKEQMNDYKLIRLKTQNSYKKIFPSDTLSLNRESTRFIFDKIEELSTSNKKIIVATHHAPIHLESGELDKISYAYFNNFEEQIKKIKQSSFWVFGHTHEKYLKKLGNTHILSNAIGYPGEFEDSQTNYLRFFEIT